MKKQISIFIFLTTIGIKSFAQPDTTKFGFLNPLQYKNGKATVVIKATYAEFFRSGDEPYFMKLSKEKKLHYSDYFTRCCGGSCLGFIPQNYHAQYNATMRERIPFDINHSKPGDVIYITCIVFKGEKYYNGDPFFVVTGISNVKPHLRQ